MEPPLLGPPSAGIEEKERPDFQYSTPPIHIPLPGERLPAESKILRQQDFAYRTGDGICSLILIEEAGGGYAVLCVMYHDNVTRRSRRPTLKDAEARFLALRDEMDHAGLKPTRFR